jgi:peptidoglycan biosynthesis protein MviN/MurJ (putative lipid II flippase)
MSTNKIMVKAAGLMIITTLLARLLGMARDMVFYTWFGQSHITDAYNAAFSIPDLIYMLLVGGALSSAFIPVFSSYLARNQEEEAWKVASIVFNYAMLLMLVLITASSDDYVGSPVTTGTDYVGGNPDQDDAFPNGFYDIERHSPWYSEFKTALYQPGHWLHSL